MCGAVARVCRKCALQLYATVVNLLIVQDRNISYGGIIRFRFYGYNLSSTIHAAPLISCLVRTQNYTKKVKRQRILHKKRIKLSSSHHHNISPEAPLLHNICIFIAQYCQLSAQEIFGPKFSSFERAAVIVLVYSVLCCLWVLLCKIAKLKKAPFSFKCTPFACH